MTRAEAPWIPVVGAGSGRGIWTLVLGLPGAGKSTVLSEVVAHLAHSGQSALFLQDEASCLHQPEALLAVMEGLEQPTFPITRLGPPESQNTLLVDDADSLFTRWGTEGQRRFRAALQGARTPWTLLFTARTDSEWRGHGQPFFNAFRRRTLGPTLHDVPPWPSPLPLGEPRRLTLLLQHKALHQAWEGASATLQIQDPNEALAAAFFQTRCLLREALSPFSPIDQSILHGLGRLGGMGSTKDIAEITMLTREQIRKRCHFLAPHGHLAGDKVPGETLWKLRNDALVGWALAWTPDPLPLRRFCRTLH